MINPSPETVQEIDHINQLLPNGVIYHQTNGHVIISWNNNEHYMEAETIHVMTDWFYRNRVTGENILSTCNFGDKPSMTITKKFKYFA